MKEPRVDGISQGEREPEDTASDGALATDQTLHTQIDLDVKVVYFGPSIQFAGGAGPAVSLNRGGAVLEAHVASGKQLVAALGKLNHTTITWGDPWRLGANIACTSAAIDGASNFVLAQEEHGTGRLLYQLGISKGMIINILPAVAYGRGAAPAIALTDGGLVVEVHEQDGRLCYLVGHVSWSAAMPHVIWGESFDCDAGARPAVAVNGAGAVLQVHGEGDELLYRVGQVSGTAIGWHPSHRYGTGTGASVALSDTGLVLGVHRGGDGALLWQVGQLARGAIAWGTPNPYSTGATAAVAMNASAVVQLSAGASDGLLYYRTGDVSPR